MLRLVAAASVCSIAMLSPTNALVAAAPPPPLPDSVAQALRLLSSLGFQHIVDVYEELRPAIEVEPTDVLTFAGATDGWSEPKRFTSMRLRADLEGDSPMFASILAHELLHVEQFVRRPDVYTDCAQREEPAYQLEADVLLAWCDANPAERFGLPAFCYNLMSVAKFGVPESLTQFATRSSCAG